MYPEEIVVDVQNSYMWLGTFLRSPGKSPESVPINARNGVQETELRPYYLYLNITFDCVCGGDLCLIFCVFVC